MGEKIEIEDIFYLYFFSDIKYNFSLFMLVKLKLD